MRKPNHAALTTAVALLRCLAVRLLVRHVFDHAGEVDRTIAFGSRDRDAPAIPSATVVGALGLWGVAALVRRGFVSGRARSWRRPRWVIGATRAPAFSPGIRASTKRGQMTCGPRDSLDQEPDLGTGVISDRIRACDAYAPEQPGALPSARSEAGARA